MSKPNSYANSNRNQLPLILEIIIDLALAVALFSCLTVANFGNPGAGLGPLLFLVIAVTFAIRRHRN